MSIYDAANDFLKDLKINLDELADRDSVHLWNECEVVEQGLAEMDEAMLLCSTARSAQTYVRRARLHTPNRIHIRRYARCSCACRQFKSESALHLRRALRVAQSKKTSAARFRSLFHNPSYKSRHFPSIIWEGFSHRLGGSSSPRKCRDTIRCNQHVSIRSISSRN